ncbi:hypothetical protein [Faecalispora anaeroviscerum]|uniref:hypothetical protein n=1 Tax=Faecalispora anaeroviscerum TaxID=2991836 RepID=UPI0024BA15D2|nr:hypothetical protein [Faecalispora anaeroviscerum]
MKHAVRIHPFFIEIIFVIFFLAVSSVAVLQIFFATNATAKKNTDTQLAIATAQTAAETLHSIKSPADAEQSFGEKESTVQGEAFISRYDENWAPVSSGGVYYAEKHLQSSATEAGTVMTLEVSVYSQKSNDKKELFSLTSQRYFPSFSLEQEEP